MRASPTLCHVVAILLLLTAPPSYAEGSASERPAAEELDGPIREDSRPMIALLAPVSGDDALFGRRVQRAVQFVFDADSAYAVEVFDVADDAASAYNDAVGAGAVAILGPIFEWRAREVIEASSPESPPIVLLTSVSGIEAAGPHVFRGRTSAADQSEALAGIALTNDGWESFAVFAPDDGYGRESAEAFIRAASQWGGVVDRVVLYEAGEPNVAREMDELVGLRRQTLSVPSNPWRTPPSTSLRSSAGNSSRPGALFIPDFSDQVVSILPFLAFHGWRGQPGREVGLLGLSGWAGPDLEFVGDLASDAWITQVFAEEDFRAPIEALLLEWGVRFEETPGEFDAQVVDVSAALMSALDQAEYLVPDITTRVLRATRWQGACGDLWFSESGGILRTLTLWQVDGAGRLYPIGEISRD